MALQQTLRSLCCKTGWCYAVFWKLKRRSRMVLTWEDGFCEYKKPLAMTPPDSLLAGSCLETGANPPARICGQGDSCIEEQISLALATLSYQVYSLGEGIIGRVAFTGKHQWIHNDGANNGSIEGNCGGRSQNILEKYPDGWQNQFAAGIKTIAVIAVLQGVVQLGSMEMITEDLNLVDQIKSLFGSLQGVRGTFHSEIMSERQGRKGYQQSTVILPIGKNPTAAIGRSAILQQSHAAQRVSDCVSVALVRELEYGLLSKIGSCNGSSDLQALFPFSKVNPAKSMVPEPQLQQSLLQLSSCKNLEGTGMPKSSITQIPSYLRSDNAFTDLLQKDTSTSSMKQFFSLNTPVVCNDVKLIEQMLIEESCPLEQPALSSVKVIPNPIQQAPGNASTSNPQMDAKQMAEKLSVKNHQQMTVGSHLEALQWNSASSSIDATSGYDHAGDMLQYRPLTGELLTNLPLIQNVYSESRNELLFQSSISNKNSMLQDGQRSSSSYNPLADLTPTSEGITANFNCPTSQVPLSVCNSMLDQKGWDGDLLNKDTFYSISQNRAKMSGQAKWDTPELQPMCSNVPCGSQYNCINTNVGNNSVDAGGFDDLENYVTSFTNGRDSLSFPFAVGDELSEALGPALKKERSKEFWEEILFQTSGKERESCGLNKLGFSSSTGQADTEVAQRRGSSCNKNELREGITAGGTIYLVDNKSESLLDAVVGTSSINQTPSQILDNNYSSKAAFSGCESGLSMLNPINKLGLTEKIFNSGTVQIFADHMERTLSEDKREHLHGHMINDSQESVSLPMSVEDLSKKAMLNSWVEEGQCKTSDSVQHSQVKKPDEISKISRKRARPGESTRPRPKDRQQIQDRVRELREIVPNGSKCSIDALLEKTIKHMRFLQNVTQHADKLKQNGELKVPKTDGSLLAHSEIESGASWALELGGQRMECPIIVENLNQPRQMRVEMLCEERGLFLEIADIIRGLGLTIMKGIMESRGDKIWARFVVEANRDVHRIEILWSLMQLLQPIPKIGSSVTTQAVSDLPSSMDSSSQVHCNFQQASLRPFQMKEMLH